MIAGAIAALAFEDESVGEQEWLERTFAMLNDTLRNTKYYQNILKEGREEGREEGLEEGLEKELARLRDFLLKTVEIRRMPELLSLAQQQAALIDNPDILNDLTLKIIAAETSKEAERALLNWNKPAKKKSA